MREGGRCKCECSISECYCLQETMKETPVQPKQGTESRTDRQCGTRVTVTYNGYLQYRRCSHLVSAAPHFTLAQRQRQSHIPGPSLRHLSEIFSGAHTNEFLQKQLRIDQSDVGRPADIIVGGPGQRIMGVVSDHRSLSRAE